MASSFNEKFVIIPHYIPKPSKRRHGTAIGKVRFVVAHDTGNPGATALNHAKHYTNTPDLKSVSAHLFVDDKEIRECVPALTAPPEKAWHVLYGVPKDNELFGVNANDAAIGVEYCYGDNIDADKAYAKYVWVLAKICFQFQLDPSKDIVGHFFLDPARRNDPVNALALSRRTYDQLLRDVVTEYNECTGNVMPPVINESAEAGTIVTAVRLNVRKAPSTRAEVVQVLPANISVPYVAVIQNGEAVNNNPIWYKDVNENFFWSGGTKQDTNSTLAQPVPVTNFFSLAPDQTCFDFIKKWEGLRLRAYQDSAGIWTIGYGTISYEDGTPVRQDDVITKERAELLLQKEVKEKSIGVNAAVSTIEINQNQYDALVSFAYNVGIGGLKGSTLLKRVKANPSDPAIRDAFMLWDKARVDGQLVVVPGLVNRRKEEADLYFL
ncbi:MAG TPA: N-acetylmuramoyl-L-alanine amidase [Parafilimonas sp.]|nr:N-acetylmuramoyl-L-alanine amidase [Parafilimonas sp.]